MKSFLNKKNNTLKLLVLALVLALSMAAFASCGGGDEDIEEVDFADYDFDLEATDLLTSARLYDYIQYAHNGEATITFD